MSSFPRRELGATGLLVSPIGIGGGSGIRDDAVLAAFDRGVNYFFYSSDLHHFAYSASAGALRTLCGARSAVRDQVVLSTVTYVNDPAKLFGVLYDQFRELRLEYVDVFHWGWVLDAVEIERLLEASRELTTDSAMCRQMRRMFGWQHQVEDVAGELRRRGLVRFCGASFHSRPAAGHAIAHGIDVAMIRYNIAHRGMERDLEPAIRARGAARPGIVAFNTSHEGMRSFHKPPGTPPTDWPVPSITDSYRFALSHPLVDVVLVAPRNATELDAAMDAVARGPLAEPDMTFMRCYGDWWRRHVSPFGDRLDADAPRADAR
jgi:predicted aldo/keto reductase-like oxidoreductase